jgi:hypothetical protein
VIDIDQYGPPVTDPTGIPTARPRFELQYVWDPATLAPLMAAHPVRQAARQRLFAAFLATAVVGILFIAMGGRRSSSVGGFGIGCLLVALVYLRAWIPATTVSAFSKILAGQPGAGQVVHLSVGDNLVAQSMPTARSEYRWDHWSDHIELEDALLLNTKPGVHLVIPRHAVTVVDWPRLVEHVAARVPRRP